MLLSLPDVSHQRSPDVPDAVYRRIKSQAALFGMSISDFLLNEIRRITGRPAIDELRARLARYPDITLRRHLWTRFGPSVAGFDHRRRLGVDWGAQIRAPSAEAIETRLFDPDATLHAPTVSPKRPTKT
jgi:hypothetical protein